MRWWVLVLVVLWAAPLAPGQEGLPAPLAGIDFAFWADRFETQMDVLSVLPPPERQRRFVDNMRGWREEMMPVMFAFRGLPPEARRELGRRLRQQALAQVGEDRAAELRFRFQAEMSFQVMAFQSLDAAGRQALIRRFWSAGTPEEPSLQNELGLDADDWLVVGGLIEQIRQLQQEMAEALSKHHQALRALLAQPDTPAADFARELEAMRLTAARYRVQLAALRVNLRQLLTLEQEAHLIVAGVLE